MSTVEQIIITRNQSVMQIGINRPEKKNALNIAMYQAITKALQQADEDPEIKVILLYGCNDIFSAGNDIVDVENRDPDKPSPGSLLLLAVHAVCKPIVAAVSGLAVGIGTTILLHCDLVYASQTARFKMPFVDLGVVPEAASSLLIPAIAGHRKAAEVMMLGDFFNAEKAIELGIVNEIIADDTLFDHALEKAQQLAIKPGNALLQTKKLLKQANHEAVGERMILEFKLFGELLESPEARDARQRFLNSSTSRK